jgi:hypothetical protein
LNFLNRFLKNIQISNLMKIRPVRAKMLHAGGWTEGKADMTKVRVAFHNFAHAPKNSTGILAWQDRATTRMDAAKIKSLRY